MHPILTLFRYDHHHYYRADGVLTFQQQGLQEQASPDTFLKQPDDVLVSSPAENFTATEAVDSNHSTHER